MNSFQIVSDKTPKGDQPGAIEALVHGLEKGINHQVLLGVTGSGKTFTMANVIERTQRPTLVLAHNKTLAGQLFGELRELFPHNAVEYFVSYYDYYQPEAYVPSTDTFIEKDAKINDEIDRLRHSATRSLLERRDVIIVASVSCIYGLGSSEAYYDQQINLEVGQECDRDDLMGQLVEIQYARNDFDFHRGTFRVRGDVVEIIPVHQESTALRLEFFGDELESISEVDPLRGTTIRKIKKIALYPASHYAVQEERVRNVIAEIRNELSERLIVLKQDGRLLEAQRLEQRTLFDLEQLEQLGHCSGIENYSRYLTGRNEGEPPPCLLDYFDEDWLMFIDESHVSVPQIGGMYRGDRSRKTTLVEHGFRLPSALDNRPLKFDEFVGIQNQVVYVSATPSSYELDLTGGVVVEQIIRPTGLVDPTVIVRPAVTQVDDLLGEVRAEIEHGRRVLVTTLTKRMAEDLTEYYADLGIQVRYLHADIDTIERSAILRDLRLGVFDVLVGINLLREGLDLPEVGLVAVLDADKEGFLRNQTSLIQTMGRAARNEHGRVLLYADRITGSMQRAMDETERRRTIQTEYNRMHGITPETVIKAVSALDDAVGRVAASGSESGAVTKVLEDISAMEDKRDVQALADQIRARMLAAAEALQFEEAADLRDQLRAIEKISLVVD